MYLFLIPKASETVQIHHIPHQLAMINNYRLSRKNATFRFVILHGHLWGGRFQMAVIGGRQVTGWIGRGFQAKRLDTL
jgi:hypothetical protein